MEIIKEPGIRTDNLSEQDIANLVVFGSVLKENIEFIFEEKIRLEDMNYE